MKKLRLACLALVLALMAAVVLVPECALTKASAEVYNDTVMLSENMSYTANVGEPFQIETMSAVKRFRSENSHIARVDDDGLVTPRKKGSTKIKVTLTNKKTLTLKLKVEDPTMPTGITLSEEGTVHVDLTGTLVLDYTLEPATAESEVSWNSNNTLVAKVKDGVVIPKKVGTATITATTKRGDRKATVKVKVTDRTLPTSISLSEEGTVEIFLQESPLVLDYTLYPENAVSDVSWNSNKSTVAKVSDGVVKLRREGTATITATTKRGQKKASVKLKIIDGAVPESISINEGSLVTLSKGETLQLTTTVDTKGGFPADTRYTWSSNKSKVASVSRYGLVEARKAGTAKITVRTKNDKKATITITVD